jgi:hypothetical protein
MHNNNNSKVNGNKNNMKENILDDRWAVHGSKWNRETYVRQNRDSMQYSNRPKDTLH